jgi:biofilm PGA synthesis N-glycosyltransferase PgaC
MRIINGLGYFVLLYPMCMVAVWMVGGLLFRLRWENKRLPVPSTFPLVTILVPAHNEEDVIRETVSRLSNLSYPNYEVIAIDDGSTDKTPEILDSLAAHMNGWLRVLHLSPNRGKAMALNKAISHAKGSYVVVIDADCVLEKNALQWFVPHFLSSDRVGAVTGNPRVRNRTTLLGKIQVGEYSYIIGLIKRAQRVYGKVLTVSGAIAAYRKSALVDVGLFDPDTVTEDIDITWKLHRGFWDVRYEPRALCWVLVPETLNGIWRQRVRWAQGGIEVLRKHVGVLRRVRYRRLWPIYAEYVLGTAWAHVFVFVCFCLLVRSAVGFLPGVHLHSGEAVGLQALVPEWIATRSILGVLCFGQFLLSLIIDSQYEEQRSLRRTYFWMIWYPAVYWLINSLACIGAVYGMITRKSKVHVAWTSPDRGIHTLRSVKCDR